MTDHPETETIAALLARGYNQHIKEHGPGDSYAGGTIESGGGHAILVERGGSQFSARVERLPAMTAIAPMTPGQCWAALKADVGTALAAHQAAVTSAGDPSLAFVNAYQYVLNKMAELEADR